MRTLNYIIGVLLVLAIAACGGGGGSPGTTPGGGSGAATPASFVYQLDKSALTNGGSDAVVLTITALTAGNNPVPGVTTTVSVDTGVYTPISGTTNDAGQASGTITIGGNRANRNITATVRVGTLVTTVVIPVTGSAIALTPVPATPAPGGSVTLAVKVTDVNNAGIAGIAVQLGGTLGFTQVVTTDSNGNATALLGASPSTDGTYSVTASGSGVSALRDVQVVGGGGGGIPDAVGPISAASLAIVPNNIAPNQVGATTNRAGLKASFRNASNQAIQNVRVRFEIVAPGLGSGEQISTGLATVYSDISGDAIADYIAGTRSSPTNGVTIRACYGLTDASIAGGLCPNLQTATMTVASQPVSVSLGDNNELAKGNNNLTYKKLFVVSVVDSLGAAIPNAQISAGVDITHYGKGEFIYVNTGVAPSATYQVTGDQAPNIATPGISTTAVPGLTTGRVWCPNEDTSRNGFIDTGEDINGSLNIEPRKADIILSYVGGNTTDTSGLAVIQVEYPQNVATWLAYTMKVTTNVSGSEGTVQKSYITNYVQGDDENGSFLTAPYGINRCVDSN